MAPSSPPLRPSVGAKVPSPVLRAQSSPRLASPLIRPRELLEDWERLESAAGRYICSQDSLELPPTFAALAGEAEEENPELLSLGESVFNLVNTMVGSGVLSIPYAFRLSGYIALPLLLVIVGITAFTAQLIGEALDLAAMRSEALLVPRVARDYGFLAEVAFGAPGRVFAGLTTSLELWLALVTFLVMNGTNAHLLFSAELETCIVSCTILTALMVRIPMRVYAYVSLLSLIVLLVGTAAFIIYVLALPSWEYPAADLLLRSTDIGALSRSVGLFVFCFAGHPCFPAVHATMRKTELWARCVLISFTITLMYYGGLGAFAYAALGQELEPCFTMNIASKSRWHGVVTLAFILKIQLTAPLILRAILASLRMMPDSPQAGADGSEPASPASDELEGAKGRWTRLCGLGLVTLVTAASACLFAGKLAAIASLTGSFLVMLTSVLLPVAFYVKLRLLAAEPRACGIGARTAVAVLLVGVFGGFAGVSGTYFAVADLASGWRATRSA